VGDDGRCGVATCAPRKLAKKKARLRRGEERTISTDGGQNGEGTKVGKRDTRAHSSSVLWRSTSLRVGENARRERARP